MCKRVHRKIPILFVKNTSKTENTARLKIVSPEITNVFMSMVTFNNRFMARSVLIFNCHFVYIIILLKCYTTIIIQHKHLSPSKFVIWSPVNIIFCMAKLCNTAEICLSYCGETDYHRGICSKIDPKHRILGSKSSPQNAAEWLCSSSPESCVLVH